MPEPESLPKYDPTPLLTVTHPMLRAGTLHRSLVSYCAYWFLPAQPEPMTEDEGRKLLFLAEGPDRYRERFGEAPSAARWMGLDEGEKS
jgi:hypothetical protein